MSDRDRDVNEEAFETGRLVALVARKDKELYKRVREIARAKHKSLQDVLAEAFELYELYSTLEHIDPKSLTVAIQVVEYFYRRAIETLLGLGALFTSDFFRISTAIASELAKTAPQQTQQVQQQPQVPLDIKQMYMNAVLPMVMNMLNNMLLSLSRIGLPQQQVQLPQPTLQATTQVERKPIVE